MRKNQFNLRNIISALLLLYLLSFSHLTANCITNTPRDRYPLLVLLETNPWLWVINADSPSFALYSDGTVIYTKVKRWKSIKYFSVKLDSVQLQNFFNELNLEELYDLEGFYNISKNYSDQPNNYLMFLYGNGLKVSRIYADLRYDTVARNKSPKSFIKIFDKITNISFENSKEWIPDKVEIMLQNTAMGNELLDWPKTWPDLNSPDTKKYNEMYSIFLDSKYFNEFNKMRDEGKGFLINGKPLISFIRYPFPEEDLWMGK